VLYIKTYVVSIFMMLSVGVVLKMRNVSAKSCRENQHILCSVIFLLENLAVYERMRKYMVVPDRPQMTIRVKTVLALRTLDN
jgi:hypothetical protein